MNKIKLFTQRHPLAIFFVLAYAFSWWPWLLSAMQTEFANPFFPLFPLGPMVAAFVLTAVISGRAGLKALLAKVVQWRVPLRWYLVALLLPVALGLSAFASNILLGAPLPKAAQLLPWATILQMLLLQLLFIQLGEEIGWRGFALPRLLEGRSAWTASLVLGLLWMGWHVPAYANGTISAIFIPFPLITSFLFTWLYQHTRGSVLIAVLFHSWINTVAAIFSPLFTGVYLEQMWWLLVGAYGLAAAVVIIITRANLRRQRATIAVTPTI